MKVSVGEIPVQAFPSVGDAVNYILSDEGVVRSGYAVAINAEKVMATRKDPELLKIIQKATLCYPDGAGVKLAMKWKGVETSKIPGCELWERLMKCAGTFDIPVYLIGARVEVVSMVAQKLIRKEGVNVVGFRDGYFDKREKSKIIEDAKNKGAKIISVAMGSPDQERIITEFMTIYPNAFYMGVGGSYDIYGGVVARAPHWVQKWNLEWLYRLVKDPRRIRRQLVLLSYIASLLAKKL